MFKVFHRGHNKVQFNSTTNNELSSNTSINKIKNANLALSYDHIRRHNSIRSTSVFGETGFDSVSIGKSNLTAANKKYVSCDNFARNFEDEYQEVIDEEFDEENSFKHKLLKPYNSVTNLLMRSFRKARIKKKKEAMLQESFIDENEIPQQQQQQQHKQQQVSKSKPSSQRESVFLEKDEFKEDENNNNNSIKTKVDESVPLFIGKRIISNEFVELKQKEAGAKSISKKESFNNKKEVKKEVNQNSSNSNPSKKPVNPTASMRLNTDSKTTLNSGSIIKSSPPSRLDNFGKIEQSSAIEVLQKFSSHMKPQAPRPPEVVAPSTSAVANKQADSKKSESIEVNTVDKAESVKKEPAPLPLPLAQITELVETSKLSQESAPKKPAVVKRSKTFTQQLQDMLKDHRLSRPELQSPSVITRKSDKQLEKSFVASVLSDEKSMRSNTNMSNMTSSLIIDSSLPRRHEFSQDYFDLIDDARFQFKSINDFNKIQLSETNSISDEDYNIEKNDELKNLIQVLEKQEPEFKSKFFECLMSKLWDPSLPIKEYVKLNKLMAALFGENYHKMESAYSSKNFLRSTDYSNCKSNQNTQIDAEYIVNLMKVYLDSKPNCSKPLNIIENNSEDSKIKTNSTSNNESDLSMNNLISSLRNRPRDELLEQNSRITPRSTNFNSVGSNNIYDIDEKLQLYGNEFSFRNGFNGLNGDLKAQKPKAKSSLVLKIDDSVALEEDGESYYKENFNNLSIDYSTKTSVINDESLTSSSHFQRDSRLRKTFFNHERPCTSSSHLSNKGSVNEETNKNKKLSMENKIEKLIKANHFNVSSPLTLKENDNTSMNTSINNEISIIANNITKLNKSNLSDNEAHSSLDSFSTKLTELPTNNKMNKIASFQPDQASKIEQSRSRSEKIKPSFNVVRTIVHPPKPKIAIKTNDADNLLKQKQFKVVNIFKNVNENILKHSSPYVVAASSMRHRDGPFLEPQFLNRSNKDEPIYQVQKITQHSEFNPIGSINKNISKAYIYLEEKNSKSLNHLNDNYPATIAQSQHSRINKASNCDYSYEPVRKIFTHHLKELMTEKHYKFERKEMQPSAKGSNSKNKLTLVTY